MRRLWICGRAAAALLRRLRQPAPACERSGEPLPEPGLRRRSEGHSGGEPRSSRALGRARNGADNRPASARGRAWGAGRPGIHLRRCEADLRAALTAARGDHGRHWRLEYSRQCPRLQGDTQRWLSHPHPRPQGVSLLHLDRRQARTSNSTGGTARLTGKTTQAQLNQGAAAAQKDQHSTGKSYVNSQQGLPNVVVVP